MSNYRWCLEIFSCVPAELGATLEVQFRVCVLHFSIHSTGCNSQSSIILVALSKITLYD